MRLEDFEHYNRVHEEAAELVAGLRLAVRLKQTEKAAEYTARIIAYDYVAALMQTPGTAHGRRGVKSTRRRMAL